MTFFDSIDWSAFMTQRPNMSTLPVKEFRDTLIEFPLLREVLHALTLSSATAATSSRFLLQFHFMLDISWDDMRTAICALRSVTGMDARRLRDLYLYLRCPELSQDLYPGPLVSLWLAQQCIRKLTAIEHRTLDLKCRL
jgi:hypothetical protein